MSLRPGAAYELRVLNSDTVPLRVVFRFRDAESFSTCDLAADPTDGCTVTAAPSVGLMLRWLGLEPPQHGVSVECEPAREARLHVRRSHSPVVCCVYSGTVVRGTFTFRAEDDAESGEYNISVHRRVIPKLLRSPLGGELTHDWAGASVTDWWGVPRLWRAAWESPSSDSALGAALSRYGASPFPLHAALADCASEACVAALLQRDESQAGVAEAVADPGTRGLPDGPLLPLHLALACGAASGVVLRLLRLHPEALATTLDGGMSALHLAAAVGADPVVLKALHAADPLQATRRDATGQRPHDYLVCALPFDELVERVTR